MLRCAQHDTSCARETRVAEAPRRVGNGFPIVLTADRTLTADYRLLFDGMLAASQTTTSPPALLGGLLMPRARTANGSPAASVAPLGLRRIEAALLSAGFTPDQVIVVDEAHLAHAIGPATRAVGICSGEPTGLGMNSSTMAAVAGGRIWPEAMFRRLLGKLRRQISRSQSKARIVLGGPGSWQIAANPDRQRELGIDHVVTGYAEDNAPAIFRALLDGHPLAPVIAGQWRAGSAIPPIRHASTMGVVEISRGCGLGCSFCTIARTPMVHLPPETILADARTNVAAGVTSIAALSEDFFRYGAHGIQANPPALIALLQQLRTIENLRLIQTDHASILSIAQYTDEQLRTVHDLLVGPNRHRYLWVNVGVETASGKLLRDIGAAGKMNRCPPEQWGDLCALQTRRLCHAGFFPMLSLLLRLPGETDATLQQTLDWVRSLSDQRISIFPMLYAPVDGSAAPDPRRLRRLHWQLIRECYRLNFRWIPRMYWDNQLGAGVPFLKRATMQVLGRGQVLQWKTLFAWHGWRAST